MRKEIWRLALAEQDMRLVASAAQELADAHAPSLVLEAGLVVIYCRSFSGAPKGGRVPEHVVDELAPKSHLHQKLWEARNRMYGHTDEDYELRRKAVDVFGTHSYSVEYQHLNPALFDPFRALALALAENFKGAREEREQALRDTGVEPEPLVL